MAILSNGRFSGFLCSIKDTGKKLKNGAKVMVDDFLSGFNGYGWKLWKKDERWRLEIDDLLVRKSFTTFEHIISQITSIKGAYSISQGHAKIKSVSIATADVYKEVDGADTVTQEQCYRLEIDDESNSIVEYDFVQCLNNGRYYLVQVGSVFQYYINIPVSEFDSDPDTGEILNAPQAGDEIVQFGNASHQEKYRNRHSAIYMHLDEEEPAIDLMTDLYTKDWSKAIKVRVGGNLPNTDGDRGFYSVNGKLLFVDEEGETVSVINPDGSASFARGKVTWTKDGDPYFNGQIISGDKEGKHIEINPFTSSINIYDEDNKLVNIFEGNSYNSIEDLYEGNIPTITIKDQDISLILTAKQGESKSETKTFDVLDQSFFYVDNVMLLTYKLTFESKFPSFNNIIVSYELILERSETSDFSTYTSQTIASSDETSGGQIIHEQNSYKVSLNVGYYKLKIRLTNTIGRNITIGDIESTIKIYNIQTSLEIYGYLSKFFANGLALGTSTDNLFSVMNKYNSISENKLRVKIKNPSAGIEINDYILKGKSNFFGLLGINVPEGLLTPILSKGKCIISGGNKATITIQVTADGEMLEANVAGGIVVFNIPDAWQKYQLASYGYMIVQPINQLTPMNCIISDTIITMAYNYISGTDFQFYFELKYFG